MLLAALAFVAAALVQIQIDVRIFNIFNTHLTTNPMLSGRL